MSDADTAKAVADTSEKKVDMDMEHADRDMEKPENRKSDGKGTPRQKRPMETSVIVVFVLILLVLAIAAGVGIYCIWRITHIAAQGAGIILLW